MLKTNKYILITGVSTGIGFGATRELINRGYTVYGTVRKQKDAASISSKLGSSFRPLIMDVTSESQVKEAVHKVTSEIGDIGLSCLINNAGIAEGGPLQYQRQADFEKQFGVNVFGLVRVTREFLPLLGAIKNSKFPPGKIINIGSVGGKIASPFVGAYAGTKHALEGISHSLRRELLIYGIDVIIIGPGPVKTPIWDKGIRLEKYADTNYGAILAKFGKEAKKGEKEGLSIEYLGHKIADIYEHNSPKVRYTFVNQKFIRWTIPRMLPARWLDRIIKKKLMG